MKAYAQTLSLLSTLNLRGIANSLDEMIHDAEIRKSSYITFLNTLFSAEVSYKVKRRVQINMTGAHFPIIKRISDFEFGRIKGMGKSEAVNLLDCAWIDNKENLLFFGPPGVGKTHLAIAFGVAAVEKGYRVCFEKITNLVKLLKTAEIQKKSEYRIRRIMKSNLAIIDEIGYTPIEKREANLFFNLISEMYEKLSIIITSNKSFESWAEMMGDSVMTTALLDRLLHHARIFNLDGESYRIKNQKKEV
ncbi:ATP-binding protein [Candidatus Aerophobetes bacterium]|uniref:ATP-binding protein n=1 Tax=Aerophobetes bacterium TaxID=2030807 RepID=A0A662CZB1_UNCAE|nr:MAG: ATP-binding protein [Candidatus Aerophobetes bacterium]